jgi:hypothetical protein
LRGIKRKITDQAIKKTMSITLIPAPITASAALTAEDITAILTALSSAVTITTAEGKMVALNLVVQPNGSGVLNVRFSK